MSIESKSSASVDVEFLLTLEKKGVDFMLKAASTRVDLFDQMVSQGWSNQLRGSLEEKLFFHDLQRKIDDKERAIHVLKSMLKGATLPELNEALLGRSSSNDECALRFWLRDLHSHVLVEKDGQDGQYGEKWKEEVLACAVGLGMDFSTEFSHKAGYTPSAKHTLLSSFVTDICVLAEPGQTYSIGGTWSDVFLAPISLILKFQKVPDKQSIVQPLKYMNDQDCASIFAIFEEKGDFNATRALQMVARSKISPEKLAPLQVRAAREAIDEMMAQTSLKFVGPAP